MSKRIVFPFFDPLKLPAFSNEDFRFHMITEEQFINREEGAYVNLYDYDIIVDTYWHSKKEATKAERYDEATNFLSVIEVTDEQLSDLAIVSLLELVFDVFKYLFAFNQNELHIQSSSELMMEEGLRNILRDKPIIAPPLIDVILQTIFRHFTPILKNSKVVAALVLWRMSYRRDDATDCILDLCASLEAFLGVSDEQSLKVALYAYHYTDGEKRETLFTIAELYQHRNNIIHGNNLPFIDQESSMKYITTVAGLLKKAALTGALPLASELEKQIFAVYHN